MEKELKEINARIDGEIRALWNHIAQMNIHILQKEVEALKLQLQQLKDQNGK